MQVLERKEGGQSKVNRFLDSVGRNSKKTRQAYSISLRHFGKFLNNVYPNLDADTIISTLQNQELNTYEVVDQFVSYLLNLHISIPSVKLYVAALRSYFQFFDIDIVPSKFKRKVKIPKHFRDEELPLDIQDIRTLLLKCHTKRLRAYLLLLASSGLRALEATSLRLSDVDLTTTSPAQITVRKEYSKTRRSRTVYCSDEAAEYIKQLLEWTYRKGSNSKRNPDNLIFSINGKQVDPMSIYFKMLMQFERLQEVVGMAARKEDGLGKRRKITLHSIRRFVKGVVSDQAGTDYSEWFLGHNHSVYWTRKEQERRNIYLKKYMPYLTVLDYSQLDTRSKNIEIAMKEKDKAIQHLRQSDEDKTKQIEEMMHKQEQFEQLIQSLIDSGQLKPLEN